MISRSLNDNYDNRIDTHDLYRRFLNESWIDYVTYQRHHNMNGSQMSDITYFENGSRKFQLLKHWLISRFYDEIIYN